MELEERRKRIAELWPDHTGSEIAVILGIKVWTVMNDVQKLGLKKGHKALPERWKQARRGSGNPNWRGGSRNKREDIVSTRHLIAYKEFVEAILSRDGYRCLRCDSQTELVVHHIKSEKEAPELLMEPTNAETLCRACHVTEHRKRGDVPKIKRAGRGEESPSAKLTEADVIEMRCCYDQGEAVLELARRFGVARRTASGIVKRQSWTHID